MSWYKMHRGWMDDPVFENNDQRIAWVWMVEKAFIKPGRIAVKGKPVRLERGQLSHSIRYLSEAWGTSFQSTRTILRKFEDWGMIKSATNTGQQIITICKYNDYQDNQQESNTPSNTEPTQDQHSPNTIDEEIKEVKEVKKKEGKGPSSADLKIAVSEYNDLAGATGLRKVQKLTETRKAHLKARLKDCGGMDGWREALEKVRGSPFCQGENDRGWKIDFDFLASENGFIKLMEGKYDDRVGKNQNTGSGNRTNRKPNYMDELEMGSAQTIEKVRNKDACLDSAWT